MIDGVIILKVYPVTGGKGLLSSHFPGTPSQSQAFYILSNPNHLMNSLWFGNIPSFETHTYIIHFTSPLPRPVPEVEAKLRAAQSAFLASVIFAPACLAQLDRF